MRNIGRVLPFTAPDPEWKQASNPGHQRKGVAHWFAWWVAASLVVLAWNSAEQLAVQRRILSKSQALQAAVAEAREQTVQTNRQLAEVARLDEATGKLAAKLQRATDVNRAIKGQLLGLEGTVDGLAVSVTRLDQEAGRSKEVLTEITLQSSLLHQSLLSSQREGHELAQYLNQMIEIQEAVNADLRAMNAKTAPLDRFVGGNGR